MLLDLQKVSFIGSMGLRSLLVPAQAIKRRGGKMVIFGPNELVEKVLTAYKRTACAAGVSHAATGRHRLSAGA